MMQQGQRNQANSDEQVAGKIHTTGGSTPGMLNQFRALRQQTQAVLRALASIAEQRGINIEETVEGLDDERLSVVPLASVLRRNAERLDGPFRLAVVGEFSRGKSSLINALLQREILASDHRPNTAASTILKYGQPERFVVTFWPETHRPPEEHVSDDLLADLARFTSDAAIDDYEALMNGGQQSLAEQIESVTVWINSDFLRQMKTDIIDTPGLGSIFPTHKQVTLKAVRVVDAILFTAQFDPGIGGREVAFIRFVKEHVSKMFFVMTKADQVFAREIPERIDHARKTIEIKARVEVEHIFPVSAWWASEGKYEKSGFPELLPTLEQFLVRSNGITRLVGPLRFTRIQARHILKLLGDSFQRLNQSQQELKEELRALQEEAKIIRQEQKGLLKLVDERIEIITQETLEGIDRLMWLVRNRAEGKIDSLSRQDLQSADWAIEAAMKDAVADWIEERKATFSNGIKALNGTIKRQLTDLLKTLEFDEEQLSLLRSVAMEIDLPLDLSTYTQDIGDKIKHALLSIGVSNIIAEAANTFTKAVVRTVEKVKGFFGRLLGRSSSESSSPPPDNSWQVRQRLREALLETLPGTTVNTYEAVVEGYRQNGRYVPGVRRSVEETFNEWGTDLKNDITSLINNNVNTRLVNLETQLASQQSGLQESAEERANLAKVQTDLEAILKTVAEIEQQLRALGAA